MTLNLFRFEKATDKICFFNDGPCLFWFKKNAKPRILEALWIGYRRGFHPIPNFSVYGILCVWESEMAARNALLNEKLFKNTYHERHIRLQYL